MQNLHRRDPLGLRFRAQVPVGARAGDIVPVGALMVILVTHRATAATIADGTAAQGLSDGEATVRVDMSEAYRATVAGTLTQGARVYRVAADGTYTTVATGNAYFATILQILSGTVCEIAMTQPGAA